MSHIEQQLRDAVEAALESGWTMSSLARSADVSRTAMVGWYNRSRNGLTLNTAAKLAAWFGTEFKKPKIPKPEK